MPYRQKTVALAEIDQADRRYQISTAAPDETLLNSIRQTGLLHPPFLFAKQHRYGILSGFRRIAAWHRLKQNRIAARIIPPATESHRCALIAVTENALQRPLNLVETARALCLLEEGRGSRRSIEQAAAACGLPDRYPIIEKIKRIHYLPWFIQQGVVDNRLSMKTALDLGDMETEVARLLTRLLLTLKASHGKQREILSNLREIALREHRTIHELLHTLDIPSLMADESLDRRPQLEVLRRRLRQRRFPSVVAVEAHTRDAIRKLHLGGNMRLKAPDNPEGGRFELQLTFQTISELVEALQHLQLPATTQALQQVLAVSLGDGAS